MTEKQAETMHRETERLHVRLQQDATDLLAHLEPKVGRAYDHPTLGYCELSGYAVERQGETPAKLTLTFAVDQGEAEAD